MSVVNRIRNELENKNIKQKELVNALAVNQGTLAKWLSVKEDNRRDIPNTILAKIANMLDVDMEYLLGIQDEKRIKLKTIPLIGIASCGVPNQSYNDIIEHIPVPDKLARDGVYAVTADGDSMLPKISHGDIVICDKEAVCENGNIVHYTTNNGESGLKKFMCKDGIVTLYPLNTDGFTPTIVKEDEFRCARAIKIMSDL